MVIQLIIGAARFRNFIFAKERLVFEVEVSFEISPMMIMVFINFVRVKE